MAEFEDQAEFLNKQTPTSSPEHEGGPSHDHGLGLAASLGNGHVGRLLGSPGVQRAGATSAQQLDESVARAIEERRGRGQPLDDDTRTQMENSLGHDLSDVRVHTDSTAHQLSETVSARAFTAGNDVFFKQGTYDKASSSGRELLGHELTHVVQQRTGTSGLGAGEVSDPADPAEQQAEAVGKSLTGQPAAPSPAAAGAAPGGVARQSDPEETEEEPPAQLAREPGTAVARQEEEELESEG